MPTPVRYTSGFTQDAPWQPLAQAGFANPFFYHTYADDFDYFAAQAYTSTLTGVGTSALAGTDGGNLLLVTNSSTPAATDIASIQLKSAGFAFVPATSTVAGKKSFFMTRVSMASVINGSLFVGLMNTTTTPGAATDGLYFQKLTGASNTLQLVSMVGSVATTLTIPTNAYTLVNNVTIDLAWYFDGKQTVYAFVNGTMIGYIPQAGTGTNTPNRGAVASFTPTLTTAVLNPTLAIISGTAASTNATFDLILAARER